MEEAKFFGMKRETLTVAGVVLAPPLTTLLVVVGMFNLMNSSIQPARRVD